MKLYNYKMTLDRDGWTKDISGDPWVKTKEEAKMNLEAEMLRFDNDTFIKNQEVVEKDFSPIIIEGMLDSNGMSYEDFDIMIGDIVFREYVYDQLRGNKVKITIEVVE